MIRYKLLDSKLTYTVRIAKGLSQIHEVQLVT